MGFITETDGVANFDEVDRGWNSLVPSVNFLCLLIDASPLRVRQRVY